MADQDLGAPFIVTPYKLRYQAALAAGVFGARTLPQMIADCVDGPLKKFLQNNPGIILSNGADPSIAVKISNEDQQTNPGVPGTFFGTPVIDGFFGPPGGGLRGSVDNLSLNMIFEVEFIHSIAR